MFRDGFLGYSGWSPITGPSHPSWRVTCNIYTCLPSHHAMTLTATVNTQLTLGTTNSSNNWGDMEISDHMQHPEITTVVKFQGKMLLANPPVVDVEQPVETHVNAEWYVYQDGPLLLQSLIQSSQAMDHLHHIHHMLPLLQLLLPKHLHKAAQCY